MAITHTNRRGEVYYLHQGQTKTGKPRYHFSRKKEGPLAESIPEGYEIYERPSAQVYLRKIIPTSILPEEVEVVKAGLRRAGLNVFLVEAEKDAIVVHMPNRSKADLADFVERFRGGVSPGLADKWMEDMQNDCSFSAMMRFVLTDEDKRLFRAERWCFRGSIDGWILLFDGPSGGLAKVVAAYAPHLDKESFFDLM
jgi:hypothetical protein